MAAGTMINYLDRTALGVAEPELTTSLHLSPEALGVVFSAFGWAMPPHRFLGLGSGQARKPADVFFLGADMVTLYAAARTGTRGPFLARDALGIGPGGGALLPHK